MATRTGLVLGSLLLFTTIAEAAPRIIELPDRIIVELYGTPGTPESPAPPPKAKEPYLVERFENHPDHYEVELVGKPEHDKDKPADHAASASAYPQTVITQTATDQTYSPPGYGGDTPAMPAQSPYYRELSERIRTLQRERQEYLKISPGEERADRERKRREAEEKLREIRAVSAEMAQLRGQGGS